MYRLSMLLTLAVSSVIILFGCSKSTEPQTQKPPYFTSTGLSYPNWHDTGYPEGILPELSSSQKMSFKARAYFYNVTPSIVQLNSIISPIPEGYTGNEEIPVLDVIYDPSLRGAYNFFPELTDPAKCWGGLQRLVSQDEIKGNVIFYQIQIWMQIAEDKPKGARLYIDLGRINEDVIPNNKFDMEDKNLNGLLENGEDTGLDGLPDKQEPFYDEITNTDPSGDNFNYSYSKMAFSNFYGTENNALSIANMKLPDTDDVDGNLDLERRNDFYRYEIQLDSLDAEKRYIVEKGGSGWIKIRIPVSAFTSAIGQPVENSPMLMRLWFGGAQSRIHLRFAELKFTTR